MTEEELIVVVIAELKGLSSKFVAADYTNAVAETTRETGWTLPNTDNFQTSWLIRRTKRHLVNMLLYGASKKFKFEQINSQHVFDQFERLVVREDKDFEKAKNDEPYRFAGVSAVQMFGTKIDAGFAYDSAGQDLTYSEDNTVVITPSSSD